jgi:TetR/AcrR family transcriptional regulator, tetracycline repressor protein
VTGVRPRPLAGTAEDRSPPPVGVPGPQWSGRVPGEAGTGERAPLTRARVLAAALDFVDREGVDALSMRKLGQALGVEAMSLYNHVESKDDLLAGVASLLLELVEVPDPSTGDWQQRLRATADDVRRVGLAHPRAFPLLVSRQLSSLESWEPILAAFALGQRAGLSAEDSVFVVTALSGFIVGFVLLEIGARSLDAEGLRLAPEDVPPDRPLLAHYVASRAATSFDRQFREGINLVIAGIEQRLGSARGR